MAIINSCLRHNTEGLISVQILFKILEFGSVFDLHLYSDFQQNEEYKEFKKKVSYLIIDYLKFSLELKRSDIIYEYVNYVTKVNNVYLTYKLLKCMYTANMKETVIEIFNFSREFKDFNFVNFLLNIIEFIEVKYFDKNDNFDKKEIALVELLKALCIRFIDEYIIKEDKSFSLQNTPNKVNDNNNNFKESFNSNSNANFNIMQNSGNNFFSSNSANNFFNTNQANHANNTNNAFTANNFYTASVKKFNSVTTPIKLTNSKNKLVNSKTTTSVKNSTIKNNNNNNYNMTNFFKTYKHYLLDRVIELIVPSRVTIKSLFLSIYNNTDPKESFRFIKEENFPLSLDYSLCCYSKDALIIFIKLIDRISNCQFTESIEDELELLKFSFELVLSFLLNLSEKHSDKDYKKIYTDIFESNKICLRLFYLCLNSYYLDTEGDKINSENYIYKKAFKEKLRTSLITIVKKTIDSHANPFYFNLIISLFCKTQENGLIMELVHLIIDKIILNNDPNKSTISKYFFSNIKNLIILLYRMIFMSQESRNKNIFFNKEFEEKLVLLFLFISYDQIIYTRLSFNIIHSKSNKNENWKQKTILEMIIEMIIELYSIHKNERYLGLLERVVIYNNENHTHTHPHLHTVFYYMDLFYYLKFINSETVHNKFNKQILDFIESDVFKEGNMSVYYTTYFYLVKMFIYLWHTVNKESCALYSTILKITNVLENDIVKLLEKTKTKSLTGFIRVELKDVLYVEIKQFFEQVYINKERDFIILKNKFYELIDKNQPELKKFYRLNADNIKNMLSSKFELSCKTDFKTEINTNLVQKKSNSCDSLTSSLKSSFITNTEEVTQNLNAIYSQSNYNSNEDNFSLNGNPIVTENANPNYPSFNNMLNKNNKLAFSNTSALGGNITNYIMGTVPATCNVNSNNNNIPTNNYTSSTSTYTNSIINTLAGHKNTTTTTRRTSNDQFNNTPNHTNLLYTEFNTQSSKSLIAFNSANEIVIGSNKQTPHMTQSFMQTPLPTFKLNNDTINTPYSLTFNEEFAYKPKKDLLMTTFGVFFRDNIFINNLFEEDLKKKYNQIVSTNIEDKTDSPKININNANNSLFQMTYPTKIKNIITQNYLRPFLKPDIRFFDSKYISISHDYYYSDNNNNNNNIEIENNPIIDKNKIPIQPNTIKFLPLKLTPTNTDTICINNDQNQISETFPCELITLVGVIFGKITFHKNYILFKSEFKENLYHPSSLSKYTEHLDFVFSSLDTDIIYVEKEIKIFFSEIKEVLIRRFLFMWQGNEIFMKNGKSFFFNLFKRGSNESFFKLLEQINLSYKINLITNCRKHFKENEYTKKWLQGDLTNFEYILLINKFCGRSFQDVNQYPVLPWALVNYSEENLDLNDKALFRNLSYPISVQNEEKKQSAIKKFEDEGGEKFKLHFRCHYSTSAFNSYYLMRLTPFNQNLIKLQTLKFDHPNRMFNSLKETWEILDKYNDNRELTPEFFYLPESFLNLNCNNFGVRSDSKRVDNLALPNWSSNAVDFTFKHRIMFESKSVSLNLHCWIDLIFGHMQLVKTKDSLNVFNKYSYEQEVNLEKKLEKYSKLKMEEKKILHKIKNKINLILNFGQTPHKLFEEKHPKKCFTIKESKTDEFTFVSEIVRSKQKFELTDFKKGVRYFNFSKNFIYILNGEREIEIFDKHKLTKKNKIRLKHFLFFNKFYLKIKKKEKLVTLTLPIYRVEHAIVELKETKFFITSRNVDKSIKIYYEESNIKEILCDSFVCCIQKSKNEEVLYTGHENGKVIMWKVEYKKNEIFVKSFKEIIAHESAVTCILINEIFNVILTGGEDGYVMIRNLHDFEILGCIKPERKKCDNVLKIIDIKMSDYGLIYITCFIKDFYILFGYTLNGLLFCFSEGLFSNVEVKPSGKILYTLYDQNKIFLTDPIDFTKIIYEKKLDCEEYDSNIISFFSYTPENNFIVYGTLNGTLSRSAFSKETEI